MHKKLSSLKEDYSNINYPTEKSIKKIIKSINKLEENTQESLKDYLFYKKNKILRTKNALSKKR